MGFITIADEMVRDGDRALLVYARCDWAGDVGRALASPVKAETARRGWACICDEQWLQQTIAGPGCDLATTVGPNGREGPMNDIAGACARC